MPYQIVPGLPGMKAELDRLHAGMAAGTLDQHQRQLAKKLFKAIAHLARDPFYPALQSHEIAPLTRRFGTAKKNVRVFQSYLENRTPAAGRLYWVYGPGRRMITLVGLEPHPEDAKSSGYARVELSRMPDPSELAAAARPPAAPKKTAGRATRGVRGRRKPRGR